MKSKLLIIIASFIFAFSNLYSAPKIEIIGGDTINWGKSASSIKTLTKDIIVKNSGSDTLYIKELKASCGCTQSHISKKIIAPHDTAILNVILHPPDKDGEIVKKIFVYSNEMSLIKEIILKVEVYTLLKVSPFPTFVFNGMEINKDKICPALKLTNKSPKDIRILSVKSSSPDIRCDLKENMLLKANDSIFVYAYAKTQKYGKYEGAISVKTDNAETDLEFKVLGFAPEEKKK